MAPTEQDLPEELDKLQISPNQSLIKSMDNSLPVTLNPFFNIDRKDIATVADEIGTISRRKGLHTRRVSESVLDERKNSQSINPDELDCLRTPPTCGVLKHSLKKAGSSSAVQPGQRKLILREPILRALQTCFSPHSRLRRSDHGLSSEGQILENVGQNSGNGVTTVKGINDFRDLIHECHSLLTKDVKFSGQLNKLSLCMQSSKNFTTIQASKTPTIHGGKFRNNRTTYPHHSDIETNEAKPNEGGSSQFNHKYALNLPRNSLSVSASPEHATTSPRCSTTCSQQAGSSVAAAACDDVTIDELASYFDTFVHIPKKMSSMAEMMYI